MITLFCEISGFFNKNVGDALLLLQRVAEMKYQSDVVRVVGKTEVMHTSEICIDPSYTDRYILADGSIREENYKQMLERKVISLEEYAEVFSFAKGLGLEMAVSVYTREGIELCEKHDIEYIKIASANFNNIPLYTQVMNSSIKKVIMDTGRVTVAEIESEMEHISRLVEDNKKLLILEHSQDGHPSQPQDHRLEMVRYLRSYTDDVGLSDHDETLGSIPLAIALGATYIERGIRPNGLATDIDETFASEIDSIEGIVGLIEKTYMSIRGLREDLSVSSHLAAPQKSCLVFSRDIVKGKILEVDDFMTGFPCLGIPVNEARSFFGRKVNRDCKRGDILKLSDLNQA